MPVMGLLNVIGAKVDGKTCATWSPTRCAAVDYSRWGRYEAWRQIEMRPLESGAIGPVATGDWVVWDRETGQQIGFMDQALMTAREQAVRTCRVMNQELFLPEDMTLPIEQWERDETALPTRIVD